MFKDGSRFIDGFAILFSPGIRVAFTQEIVYCWILVFLS
ncbi:hypothetical protein LEP1GSC034_4275 [Leptospira interrogans str. 2003000735]|uniref:Uncharacterized protein n=11 Tax=Leptospira interrogans TaxID=173 RepID=M6ZQN6_LEPIR|nr:hypothetical protein G436_4258 [Leptospira interrogans serovar Hardjo str. Norma]EJP02137.1 hypothetical protein LEP1GSC007_3692 [Leptospira interrogans serovar Bulgarica str. Mallika]EJP14310.1 hypothetical protein LEP1GSC080_4436 [Leptospira interrogans str. FPW2026]EKN88105.1 hypothetical protein LEP1GSC027_3764 [Leptospira interrogans str. 2002000624]EKO07183.1 hypothetical protein LEP1GSC077_0641 [Leptospira interrogans str. C10069]EKO23160.1 hypothetical protein LEP1GSC104_0090 [Lepto